MQLLDDETPFPHPFYQTEDGLVAVGGRLSVARLIEAYTWGIFPWYERKPVLWWSPLPRYMILFTDFKVPKSLRSFLRNHTFKVSINASFDEVIHQCQITKRKNQEGTWIQNEMITKYSNLHDQGLAHSVEVWDGDELVGGLYGVAIGRVFYGESMFSKRSNVSKLAFVTLVKLLDRLGFYAIDCQMETPLLRSFGGDYVSPTEFWNIIRNNLFNDQKYLHNQLTSS